MTEQREPQPQRRSWPRRMLNRMEVNRAVFYALLSRGWQFVSGPVTMLLIIAFFSSELQGYYYTFGALIALQTFVEMGMQVVTLYLASHEWSKLKIDEQGALSGDADALSRIRSLASLVLKWYSVAGLLFVGGIGMAGYYFFSSQPVGNVDWQLPWLCVAGLTALSLIVTPCLTLLDGCDQVAVTNRYRAFQSITGTLVAWLVISSGGGIWTCVAICAVRLFWELWLIVIRYRRFFTSLLPPRSGALVSWSEEVWPLQWKLAVQAMATYFTSAFVIPLMFEYQGPEVAGRLGLTWSALMTLQLAAYSWLLARAPLFGSLVSQNNIPELNRVLSPIVTGFHHGSTGGRNFVLPDRLGAATGARHGATSRLGQAGTGLVPDSEAAATDSATLPDRAADVGHCSHSYLPVCDGVYSSV